MFPILETLSDPRWHFGPSLSRIALQALRGIGLQSLCHLQLLTYYFLPPAFLISPPGIIITISQLALHSGSYLVEVPSP